MRREDIKQGVVYAYDEGKYSGYSQIVFLTETAKGQLHVVNRHRKPGEAVFKATPSESQPGRHGASTYGWLAARGRDVAGASLKEALTADDAGMKGKPYSYTLMTNMAKVTGPSYAEVTAELEKAERERAEAKAACEAFVKAATARMEALHERMAALGVESTLSGRSYLPPRPPTYFHLSEEQALRLAELLEGRGNGQG